MPPPLVSVLVVTHNSANEIGPCPASLAQATHLAYEVTLVDNASCDGVAVCWCSSGCQRCQCRFCRCDQPGHAAGAGSLFALGVTPMADSFSISSRKFQSFWEECRPL